MCINTPKNQKIKKNNKFLGTSLVDPGLKIKKNMNYTVTTDKMYAI